MGCGISRESHPAIPTTTSSHSPVYASLPKNATKVTVRNVYDGDTLTLTDERRVRFLGVDTPELKEKQPFAQEAKDYTKNNCPKQDDIYIVVEGEDHYGRLLAWIYVKQSSGYLCVNEGLVNEGFAFAYIPNKSSKPFNWDKLLRLQTDARTHRRGLWKTFQDSTVYKTSNGSAYHKKSCKHIANSRLETVQISQALEQGLHPCRTCCG